MNFVTSGFVLFFLPVLCMGWALRRECRAYKGFILLASLLFYACAGVGCLVLLAGVALLDWGAVRLMAGRSAPVRKGVMWGAVSVHVLMLAFYKYYEPLVSVAMEWFGNAAEWMLVPALADLAMPVGLSFYTFQGLSYLIDHYKDGEAPSRSFPEVLCYLSFFPTVMSGPIMREGQFFPQLLTTHAEKNDFSEGSLLILSGLFKKVVLATYLQAHAVDPLFEDATAYSQWAVWVGVYAYAIQIYCDFSGYTDLALGVGRLMGFRLPDNFNAPYRALNVQDFWRRWHISLSLWLRDYLYIPMGGSRRGNRYVHLVATMVIGGIWHGSGWTFVVWGGLHGLGLAVVHMFHRLRQKLGWEEAPRGTRSLCKVMAWLLTFHFIALLWVFFRAESLEEAVQVLQCAITPNAEGWGGSLLVPVAIAVGLLLQFAGAPLFRGILGVQARLPWPLQGVAAGLAGALILNMGPEGALPFIYFNF